MARSRLLLLSPGRRVRELRQHLDQLRPRLTLGFCRGQETSRRHLTYCESRLANLDPMAILARGYAVATRVPEGTIIRDATTVPQGAGIKVRVAKGCMDCEVVETTE